MKFRTSENKKTKAMPHAVCLGFHEGGQALMIVVIFLLFISLLVIGGMANSALGSSKLFFNLINSKKSYFLAEAGAEDLVYRIFNGKNYSIQEALELEGFFASITVSDVAGDIEINSGAGVLNNFRKLKLSLRAGSGASFHYGVQIGDGGLVMENLSAVVGNVYSNGVIESFDDNEVKGDVVSAGVAGSIKGVYATGTAYANSILESEIDGDAYYQTISDSIVWGALYPNSPNQPMADLPISDELIEEWKQAAVDGGVISSPCPYEIDSDISLGPVKIDCDFVVSGDPTITLSGPVWVNGNIIIENNAVIEINPSVGDKSIAVVADNPLDRLTSSKIHLKNNTEFYGSGQSGSYVLFVSQNNSAENGGEIVAIEIENNAFGDLLLYAGHGEILLKNNVELCEVTGYKIHLENLAEVIYETGLASLLFESGPAGGMSIADWREIQ